MTRIVFIVISSRPASRAVEQLVDVLAPHRVVIHHDFSKAPDFELVRSNATLIPDPKLTGWGTWGLVEAVLHTIRFCLEHFDCDYIQLLSEGCLPIRPLREFEHHVEMSPADLHADIIALRRDEIDTWMTYAYRAFLPAALFRHRMARRTTRWYFGANPEHVMSKSLVLLKARDSGDRCAALRRRITVAMTRFLVEGPGTPADLYSPTLRPMVGSLWFGARRRVCEQLLEEMKNPAMHRFFSGLSIVDEHLFPTILGNSPFTIAPSHHGISRFDQSGHTLFLEQAEVDAMVADGKFFARKFPADPVAPVRRYALERAMRT